MSISALILFRTCWISMTMVASSSAPAHTARHSHLVRSAAPGFNLLWRLNGATMPSQTLAARVERLEERVTTLEQLPTRLDALTLQVSQLGEEMRAEFSAMRTEMRTEIRTGDERILTQVRMLHEDVVSKLALIEEGRRARRK